MLCVFGSITTLETLAVAYCFEINTRGSGTRVNFQPPRFMHQKRLSPRTCFMRIKLEGTVPLVSDGEQAIALQDLASHRHS